MPESEPRNVMEKFFNSVANILVTPTVWVRGNFLCLNLTFQCWYELCISKPSLTIQQTISRQELT